MRVDELVAGVKADVALLLYGDDMQVLGEKGREIESLLRTIDGAVDVKADYQANIPTLAISTRPDQLARFGIPAAEVMTAVEAVGGRQVGQIYEGRARFPVMVRLPLSSGGKMQACWNGFRSDKLLANQSRWGCWPILSCRNHHPGIEHEAGRRRTFVSVNVRGRDVASFVAEAKSRVENEIALPAGYVDRVGRRFRKPAIGKFATGHHHARCVAVDLDSAVQHVRFDAIGVIDLPGGSDGGVGRRHCTLAARDAVQHFGRSRFYCAVWRGGFEWAGVGQRCRSGAKRGACAT